MIAISGMSTLLALKLVDATEDKQHDLIRNDPRHARAIEHFYENIEAVETVDDLMADPELYAFVMRAYDLEDQIFGKAMMEKILKSNVEEDDALINRLTDSRFRDFYDGMGFGEDGIGNLNTILSGWQDKMVERYVDRHFINDNSEQNETLGTVLEFRRKVESIESPLDILTDKQMTQFFQRSLGLPSSLSGLDIDRQIDILTDKFDFEDLKDPKEVDRMITRYVAISDALSGQAAANNGALLMLQSMNGGANVIRGTIDVTSIIANGRY